MAYTTEGEIEKYLGVDIDNSYSAQIVLWIAGVKAWIDRYCGRVFEAASTTKYYDGNRSDRILVDPFVGTPTEVLLLNYDGSTMATLTEGAGADYVCYPLNSTQKNEIVLMPNASVGGFVRAFENLIDDEDSIGDVDIKRLVKITASFGASTACPDDIRLVATMLVAKILEKAMYGGTIKSESLGDYSVTLGDISAKAEEMGIMSILDGYREPTI